MKARGGKRLAVGGERDSISAPSPFAESMREQGMVAPAALHEALQRASVDSPEEILERAEKLLDRVLAGECESRDSAFDLLTVDALVTRALIVASRDPDSLAAFTAQAIKRISTR